jgi:hypothetical protein
MSNPLARQSGDQPSSPPKSKHQFWASAACPVLDHDTGELDGVSSSAPPLSASCVGIVAAAGGIAVANLYYNQPMLPDIAESFGVSANVIGLLPMLTQIGYAIGLLCRSATQPIAASWRLRCSWVSSFRWLALLPHPRWCGSMLPAYRSA